MLSRTWQIRQVFISMSRCRGFESIALTQIKNLDKFIGAQLLQKFMSSSAATATAGQSV